MKTTIEQHHKYLIKRYHTLCTRLGMTRSEREALLSPYGVSSSLELDTTDLQTICIQLDQIMNPNTKVLSKWRKRVMASIGGWLRLLGQEESAPRIKAIACRASAHDQFNEIPVDRLRNIYYSFLNKQKDFMAVSKITEEEMDMLSYLN